MIFCILLIFCNLLENRAAAQALTEKFDVYTYQSPPFFIKTSVNNGLQFSLENNDTSFCAIRLYKKGPARKDLKSTVIKQWNARVHMNLGQADKKPALFLTGEKLDGWDSALCVGNFYHNNKKSVVMLYSFKKGRESACIVFAFSDKIFKQQVEQFSKNLHLINQ